MIVINPTIGRRVLVFVGPAPKDQLGAPHVNNPAVPFEGGIAYIHNVDATAGSMVNIGYTDHNGVAHSQTSVRLYDRAQDTADAHGKIGTPYAVWMEYQFEQALLAQQKKPQQQGGDVALVKLEENGQLTDAGLARVNDELGEQDQQERG